MSKYIQTLCVAAWLALAGTASAQTTWWLDSPPGVISGGVYTVTSDSVKATVTGYANTGSGPNVASYALEAQTASGFGISDYSGGIGLKNQDACGSAGCDINEGSNPEHAFDNNERYDMALVAFDKKVNLTGFRIGWSSNDSDMTIMAYTGTGTPTLAGSTWSSLVASGWTAISNVFDVPINTTTSTNLTTYSSFWLIGAYNDLASGGDSKYLGKLDYVKISKLKGIICTDKIPGCVPPPPGGGVPEPGSLALFALGLSGLAIVSRRRRISQ